jgi:hypothetical protein
MLSRCLEGHIRSVNGVPKLTYLVHISLIYSLHSCLKKTVIYEFMAMNLGSVLANRKWEAVLHWMHITCLYHTSSYYTSGK